MPKPTAPITSPVNFEFLSSFTPRIIDVIDRDVQLWEGIGHELHRPATALHVLAVVTGGRGLIEVGERSGSLQRGDLFQFAPGTHLRITSSREQLLRYQSIHFDYGLLRWEGGNGVWQPKSQGALPFPALISLGERPALHEEFHQLVEVWNTKSIGYEWHARVRFTSILDYLARAISESRQSDETLGHAVRTTIEYIKLHLHERIDRNALAQHVSLSPSYFSTLFKQHTGYSPTRYIHKLRIDRAKQLLQNTSLSIRRIAEEVGFPNAYYFTRVFTRETGLSPRSYRRG